MIKSLIVGGDLADVRLYGFDKSGTVDLSGEFSGRTHALIDAAAESLGAMTVCGIHFRLGDMTRFSALTFKDGMLVDVADCNLHEGTVGGQLKVLSLGGVNLGLIVDDDIDSEIVWRRLAEKSDGIIAVVRFLESGRLERMSRLSRYFDIPAVVRCGESLYAFGAEEVVSENIQKPL